MKKLLAVLMIVTALAATGGLFAQSLTGNEFLRKSVELKAQAERSFDDGDYDAAHEYAIEAQKYASLSDEYVAKMVAKAEADRAIAAAKQRIAWAESVKAPANYPKEFAAATEMFASSLASYSEEQYPDARQKADEVLMILTAVSGDQPLPAVYVVRLIPARRDCLWRIAEYPFIYNNPLKWPVIYEANKSTFRDPNNPNLIYPGQKLQIPSISGELRKGTYDPAIQYPAFPKKK